FLVYIPHSSRILPAFDSHLSPLINKGEYIGDICVYYCGKTAQAIADCMLSQYVQVDVRPDRFHERGVKSPTGDVVFSNFQPLHVANNTPSGQLRQQSLSARCHDVCITSR